MTNLDKINDVHRLMQVMASSIIETQEALKVLTDETEQTLKLAGGYCLTAEMIMENMMLEDNL